MLRHPILDDRHWGPMATDRVRSEGLRAARAAYKDLERLVKIFPGGKDLLKSVARFGQGFHVQRWEELVPLGKGLFNVLYQLRTGSLAESKKRMDIELDGYTAFRAVYELYRRSWFEENPQWRNRPPQKPGEPPHPTPRHLSDFRSVF